MIGLYCREWVNRRCRRALHKSRLARYHSYHRLARSLEAKYHWHYRESWRRFNRPGRLSGLLGAPVMEDDVRLVMAVEVTVERRRPFLHGSTD